ncbi:MAG: ATP-grasp domain-containing protein [Pseudonocardiaceae bacterium]
MIKNLIMVSQAYVHYATPQSLERAAAQARLTVVLHGDELVYPRLEPYVSEVHRLTGLTRYNLQPSFTPDDLAEVVTSEMQLTGGDPAEVALFCQHEDNVLPTAQVRHRFGIAGDSPDLICRFRDKIAMKEALAPHLPDALPRYRRLAVDRIAADAAAYHAELVDLLGSQRLIVKPTAGAGSVNVAVISSPDDLVQVAERISADSRAFEYEVDELLEGTMHQCDSFVRDGKVVFSGILELGCSNFDFVQGQPLSVYPVTDEVLYRQLFDYNQDVITALGFRDGSTHHELFLRRDAEGRPVPRFLEIAARVPGGLGIPFHERNSGINLMDANLLLALGDPAVVHLAPQIRNNVVSALLPVGHGTVVARNEPTVTSPYTIDWRVSIGDVVNSQSLIDNAGILTLINNDPTALRKDFESLASYVPVTCE